MSHCFECWMYLCNQKQGENRQATLKISTSMLIKSTARPYPHHITDKKQCPLNYCKQLFIFTNIRHHYQKSHYFQKERILIWHKNCNSLTGINYFFTATMIHGTLLKLICCTCTNTGSAKESFASREHCIAQYRPISTTITSTLSVPTFLGN